MFLLLACTDGVGPSDSTTTTVDLPSWLPNPNIVESQGDSEGGAIVASILQSERSAVLVMDRDGAITWAVELPGRAVPSWVEYLGDGTILYNEHHRDRTSDGGEVITISIETGDSVTTSTPAGHHGAQLDGDSLAYVQAEFREMEWEGEIETIAGDSLVIRNHGDTEGAGRTLYSVFDDWEGELFSPCGHFDNDVYYTFAKDWSHVNSLLQLEDTWVMEARHWDAFLGIDKDSGELDWVLGGDESDWSPGPDTTEWSHPHVSKMSDEVIVMFDNGDHKEPRRSRAVVYDLDMDERVYTQRLKIPEENSEFLPLLGDAQLLPGGNILVSWSELGRVDEYTPDGELVWRLEMPLGTIVGRIDHIP